jgi:hypothetical protein
MCWSGDFTALAGQQLEVIVGYLDAKRAEGEIRAAGEAGYR